MCGTSSNGTNRIDFIVTQGNPAEFNGTSCAGYVQGNRVHNTQGTVLGPLDGSVRFGQLTPVFNGTPSAAGGTSDTDAWTSDIEEDGAGRPVVTFSVRLPTPPAAPGTGQFDHRYYIGRWTGSRWQVHQVAFAGGELYHGQDDYTGTVAIDPVDPNHLFISTNVNPRTGGSVVSNADGHPHWEIYEGRSTDSGATWTWSAVTANSTSNNIRPTAITGPHGDFALLWLRGQYPSYIKYNLRVMGIVRATPTGRARVTPSRVGGAATATAGRFGGTSRDDLFVSGPPRTATAFVSGTPRRRLVAKPLRQTYSFRSFNPQGSGPDTLLALPTDPSRPARTWRLNVNSSITSGSLARPAKTEPVIADVNGDGRDDIFWYGPGAIRDQLWSAKSGGGFRIQAMTVQRNVPTGRGRRGRQRARRHHLVRPGRDERLDLALQTPTVATTYGRYTSRATTDRLRVISTAITTRTSCGTRPGRRPTSNGASSVEPEASCPPQGHAERGDADDRRLQRGPS